MKASDLKPCWIEKKAAELIARAKRSEYKADIFDDAKRLRESEGYTPDIALAISCRYWLS